MRSLAFAVLLLLPSTSAAQSFADGAYEDFPSSLMAPVGPLTATPPPSGRWVEVTTSGARTTVRFLPDGRMRWVIRWGAHGPTVKRIVVDGETVATSRFTYDEHGHLAAKDVAREGAPSLHYDYRTDDAGRVLERRGAIPARAGLPPVDEVVTITRDAHGTTTTTTHGGREVRRDLRDPEGRLLETRFSRGSEHVALHYLRDAAGALVRVERELGGLREEARMDAPRPELGEHHLNVVIDAPIERAEALLLFGPAARSTDAGRGGARVVSDDWSGDACWLNAVSELRFDGAGVLIGDGSACICGFCVAAESVVSGGEEVLATGTHWWSGPWVVLDGVWVTPEHEVLTPSGPRTASSLSAGERVARADGSARPLETVERIEATEPRRTVNLHTADGTFVGGDLVFVDEAPRACP